MIDPVTMLILIALYFGSLIGVVCFLVIVMKRAAEQAGKKYEVGITLRIVAFVIDYLIIRMIHDSIMTLVATGDEFFLTLNLLNPYFAYYIANLSPLLIYEFAFYYLFYFYTISFAFIYPLSFLYYFLRIFTVIIFAFFYFFSCDAFLGGRTIGKMITKIKSVGKEGRALTFKDVILNALGKSFLLLWDLIIGIIAWSISETRKESQQIRMTQRLTNVLVIDVKYKAEQVSDFWLDDNAV